MVGDKNCNLQDASARYEGTLKSTPCPHWNTVINECIQSYTKPRIEMIKETVKMFSSQQPKVYPVMQSVFVHSVQSSHEHCSSCSIVILKLGLTRSLWLELINYLNIHENYHSSRHCITCSSSLKARQISCYRMTSACHCQGLNDRKPYYFW